jgi:phenylacetate-CoA ligase
MHSEIYRTLRHAWPGGHETCRYLKELDETQWFSRHELEAWQLTRIQRIVKYAYEHVPYYRDRYRGLDIHPDDIKYLKDFQALPFLTRDDVNANLDSLVSPEFRSYAKLDSTGGSTGQPMHFYIEKSFHWWDAALEFRGRGWYGVREGEKIAWVWGAQRDMDTWGWKARLKAKILQNRYLNAFSLTEPKMKAFAEMLVKWQPAMFRAYASALSMLAEYVRAHGIRGICPRFIETTAEKTTAPQRELLEEVFQCPVADWYTARELGTIGFQCESGGVHVCETRYLEIAANGEIVRPDQIGEVVITSLNQMAMPLIRYKIGDMAIYEPGGCACGRSMPVIREVVGRVQDFLVTTDGHFVHGGYFPHTFRIWPEIFRYQVYQPDRAHLEVQFVCRSAVDSAWVDRVRQELLSRFGSDMIISIKVVDEIKLTPAGKHRFIISEVKPNFI